MICKRCNGVGQIRNEILMDDRYDEMMDCPKCYGEGKIPQPSSPPAAVTPELRAACLSVGNLAGAHERLRKLLMQEEPWPLRDILSKLCEASEILLHQKNYDGDGWEQISHAVDRAKTALSNWPNKI